MSSSLYGLSLALHVLSVTVWVGGMFFAYMALRPVAASVLQPPQRLPLWSQTFAKFFPWVWLSVVLLLITGFGIIFAYYGGMGNILPYVHTMLGLGSLMMLIFAYVFFVPYKALKQAVAIQDWPAGAQQLAKIRILIGINLALGIITILVGGAGKYIVLGAA